MKQFCHQPAGAVDSGPDWQQRKALFRPVTMIVPDLLMICRAPGECSNMKAVFVTYCILLSKCALPWIVNAEQGSRTISRMDTGVRKIRNWASFGVLVISIA